MSGLPKVRRRYRALDGLVPLFSTRSLSAQELRIDRGSLSFTVQVHGSTAEEIENYRTHVFSGHVSGPEDQLIGGLAGQDNARIPARSGAWTLGGKLKLFTHSQGRGLRIRVYLEINPTRTLGHAWAIAGNRWAELDPRTFFRPAGDEHRPATLDRGDNITTLAHGLDNDTVTTAAGRWREGLILFNAKLKGLLSATFAPLELGFNSLDGGESWSTENDAIQVILGLDTLTLRSAEIYAERWGDALSFMRTATPRVLQAAREVEATQYFAGHRVTAGRRGEAPSLRVPQAQNYEMAAYSKTERRVRFECRYRRDLASTVGPVATGPEGRLISLFDAVAAHAERRIGHFMDALKAQADEAPAAVIPKPEATARLARLVFEAAIETASLDEAEGVLTRLIADGGVSLPSVHGRPSAAFVAALERRGAVTRTRFQVRETGALGRRWRVARDLEAACFNADREGCPVDANRGSAENVVSGKSSVSRSAP